MEIIREWHGQSYKQIQIPVIVAGVQAETIYINKMVSRLVSEMEHTPEAVFGKWTFSKDQALFMNDYGFFGLVFNVSGLMIKDCVPSFPVELKDECGVSEGNDFTVTIAEQDGYDNVCIGGQFVLESTVTGGFGTPTYQWQILVDETWTDIDGATDATYEETTTGDSRIENYRLNVTKMEATEVSNQVAIQMYDQLFAFISTADANITILQSTTITSDIAGGTGESMYQWQLFVGEDFIDIAGETTTTLNVSGAEYGEGEYLFRLNVTQDGASCTSTSNQQVIIIINDGA